MVLRVWPVGPLQCNCIVAGDTTAGEALVVDPGGDAEQVLYLLSSQRLRCSTIVNTHAHIDHVMADAEVRRLTGARLLMHAADQPLYDALQEQAVWLGGVVPAPEHAPVDATLAHGDIVRVGSLSARVLHTPGHSPGSICLLFDQPEPLLLAGDTLFAGGVGRTDLPGGDTRALAHSLRQLLTLDDRTRVVPGHGPETTIGAERRSNPFLAELTA
jgi:hydroxyacylglutathione hydrolase